MNYCLSRNGCENLVLRLSTIINFLYNTSKKVEEILQFERRLEKKDKNFNSRFIIITDLKRKLMRKKKRRERYMKSMNWDLMRLLALRTQIRNCKMSFFKIVKNFSIRG